MMDKNLTSCTCNIVFAIKILSSGDKHGNKIDIINNGGYNAKN